MKGMNELLFYSFFKCFFLNVNFPPHFLNPFYLLSPIDFPSYQGKLFSFWTIPNNSKFIFCVQMAKMTIFFLCLLIFSLLAISFAPESDANAGEFNCATLPPALWCACEKVQQKCGFTQKCGQYENAVKNKPVHITLLYESLCPDCQQFISNKLYDVYQRFKDFVRIELVPYGNARVLENGTIECQHGAEECRINKWESCAIHYMHDPLPFIYCMETLIANGMSLEKAAKQCYSKLHPLPHIYDQITHCFNGQKGDQLQKIDAQRTENIFPDQHEFVPWILVNNASFQNQQYLQQDLPTLICQSYVGDSEIGHCEAFQQSSINYGRHEDE